MILWYFEIYNRIIIWLKAIKYKIDIVYNLSLLFLGLAIKPNH